MRRAPRSVALVAASCWLASCVGSPIAAPSAAPSAAPTAA